MQPLRRDAVSATNLIFDILDFLHDGRHGDYPQKEELDVKRTSLSGSWPARGFRRNKGRDEMRAIAAKITASTQARRGLSRAGLGWAGQQRHEEDNERTSPLRRSSKFGPSSDANIFVSAFVRRGYFVRCLGWGDGWIKCLFSSIHLGLFNHTLIAFPYPGVVLCFKSRFCDKSSSFTIQVGCFLTKWYYFRF